MANLVVDTSKTSPKSWVLNPSKVSPSTSEDIPSPGESSSWNLSEGMVRSPTVEGAQDWVMKPNRSPYGSPDDLTLGERHSHFMVASGSVPRNVVPVPARPRTAVGAAELPFSPGTPPAATKSGGEGDREQREGHSQAAAEATFVDFFGKKANAGSSLAQLLAADAATMRDEASGLAHAEREKATGTSRGGLAAIVEVASPLAAPAAAAPQVAAPGSPPGPESLRLVLPEVPRLQPAGSSPDSPALLAVANRDSSVREAPPDRSAASSPVASLGKQSLP